MGLPSLEAGAPLGAALHRGASPQADARWQGLRVVLIQGLQSRLWIRLIQGLGVLILGALQEAWTARHSTWKGLGTCEAVCRVVDLLILSS